MTTAGTAAGRNPVSAPETAVPLATYRLQFTPAFTLRHALDVVPYLDALGVTHIYASPFLKARPGSEHGYDITDHNALNPEIGGWDDFVRLTDALRARGMGLILDFVPNHMGIGKADNAWWLDVLEFGQNSIYSDYFDIDWSPFKPGLKGRLLLPLLGDHYGRVLVRGELVLRFDAAAGALDVWYHDHRLPLRPRSYAAVIRRGLANSEHSARLSPPLVQELTRLAREFDSVRRVGRRRREEMRRRSSDLKAELAALCAKDETAAAFLSAAAESMNGTPADPRSFRSLHALLERQHYRPAFWRVAADEINYRRFFNINELAGLRMEHRALFDVAHRLVGRMIAEGRLHGLRIDHIDGLFDPHEYCRRLQDFARSHAPSAAHGRDAPFYIVVEKILARHETLRTDWPISGTTGYEFAALVNGLFVDPRGETALDEVFREITRETRGFDEILLAAKDTVIETLLAGELGVLANELDRISECHWDTRDYTMQRLRDALKAVVVHFPVYRTYVSGRRVTADDRRDIDWAVRQAREAWRGADREIFDFVHEALTGDLARRGGPFRRTDIARFAMHFQQYTGPIMAKSMEDTAFYRYPCLLSLNEVGSDPRQFGVSPAAFHHANRQRARHWPHSMLATATHDTKRGEDARLRIDALSEMAEEWARRVRRWAELARTLRRAWEGGAAPSPADELTIYQTLVGAWPAEFLADTPDKVALEKFASRIEHYVIKAVREAKLATSWDNPQDEYESACAGFVRGLLTPEHPFIADFSTFVQRVAFLGMLSSLAQTALRLTAPGVPDTYQGTELWDLSLVDPDNRSPVDFVRRRNLLDAIVGVPDDARVQVQELLAQWHDGRIKLFVLHRLLQMRRRHRAVFLQGSYEPLASGGAQGDRLVAYARRLGGEDVLVVAGRLFYPLAEADAYRPAAWGNAFIELAADLRGRWRDALTGAAFEVGAESARIPAALLLHALPAAVLIRTTG